MKITNTQRLRFRRIRTNAQMRRLTPSEFELFVGWLYRKKGYRVRAMGKTGDEGVDLVLRKWGRKTIVQVKRYSGTVGQPVIRDLYGGDDSYGRKASTLSDNW